MRKPYALVLLGLLLAAGAFLFVREAGARVLQVNFPADVKLVPKGSAPTSDDGGSFQVKRGGTLLVRGKKTHVFIEEGGSASVVGTENVIYAASGASLVVQTPGNKVYLAKGAALVKFAEGNERIDVDAVKIQLGPPAPVPAAAGGEPPRAAIASAPTPAAAVPSPSATPLAAPPANAAPATNVPAPQPEAPTTGNTAAAPTDGVISAAGANPPMALALATTPTPKIMKALPAKPKGGSSAAVTALGIFGSGIFDRFLRFIPAASPDLEGLQFAVPPRDPENALVGGWKITRFTVDTDKFSGVEVGAEGNFMLYRTGAGVGQLRLDVPGWNGTRLFRFRWRATENEFILDEKGASESRWKRVRKEGDLQETQLAVPPAMSVVMRIERDSAGN